jgi:hypothetical protein
MKPTNSNMVLAIQVKRMKHRSLPARQDARSLLTRKDAASRHIGLDILLGLVGKAVGDNTARDNDKVLDDKVQRRKLLARK